MISPESFLQGVNASSPVRRLLVLWVCAGVAGAGWWQCIGWQLSRLRQQSGWGKRERLHHGNSGLCLPPGGPAARLLSPENSRTMVACGAGAGLAAVYNVPLTGALFTPEVLLRTFSLSALIRGPRDMRHCNSGCLDRCLTSDLSIINAASQLLGNGRSVTQLSFQSDLGLALAVTSLVLRLIITIGVLRAGRRRYC